MLGEGGNGKGESLEENNRSQEGVKVPEREGCGGCCRSWGAQAVLGHVWDEGGWSQPVGWGSMGVFLPHSLLPARGRALLCVHLGMAHPHPAEHSTPSRAWISMSPPGTIPTQTFHGDAPLPTGLLLHHSHGLLVSFQAGATDILFLCRSDASLYCDDVDIRFSKTMNSCKVLQIRYASVERLLERLTDLRFLSIDFLNTFLHSYRVFTTALVVLDKLITIYKKPISAIPAR